MLAGKDPPRGNHVHSRPRVAAWTALFSGTCGGDLTCPFLRFYLMTELGLELWVSDLLYGAIWELMHWWELFVLAGTVWLMCSAEVFALCHPHLLFGKRSSWGMPYNFWLTYWDILCLCTAQDIAVRGWWRTQNKIKFGFHRRSVRRVTSWTFTHRHLQLPSNTVWLIGCRLPKWIYGSATIAFLFVPNMTVRECCSAVIISSTFSLEHTVCLTV